MADSLASTKALTQSFATSQILAESAKNAQIIQQSMAFPQWEHIDPLVSYEEEQFDDLDERTIDGDDE